MIAWAADEACVRCAAGGLAVRLALAELQEVSAGLRAVIHEEINDDVPLRGLDVDGHAGQV